MSLSRKIKRGAKKPPLSRLDNTIYVILILLGIFIIFFMMILWLDTIPTSIAFADKNVIAYENYSVYICAIPLPFLHIMPFAALILALKAKLPIFGNKKFKSNPFEPTIKVYPLFSREFGKNLSQKLKQRIKKSLLVFSAVYLICAVIYSLSLCARTVIMSDDTLVTYNSFNSVTHTYSIEEMDKLEIKIECNTHKGSTSYTIVLSFSTDERTYDIRHVGFKKMTTEETLRYILHIKGLFGEEKCVLENTDMVDSLIDDRHLSQSETALVYEIFDIN